MRKNFALFLTFFFCLALSEISYADSWQGLGSGFNNTIYAVTSYRGKIVAAGSFTNTGSTPANRIAVWNGNQWTPMGSGMNNTVYALCVFNDELYAGGDFTTAGGNPASRIAKWNGSGWSEVGDGFNGPVYALTVYNNKVVAGGQFLLSGLIPLTNIAVLTDGLWGAVGGLGILTTKVKSLAVYNNELIAGGDFLGGIQVFNGLLWAILGGIGLDSGVDALAVYNNELIAGGRFTGKIKKYNSGWSALGGGLNGNVSALTVFRGSLVAGGDFTTADPSGSNVPVSRIAGWNGSMWKQFSGGMDSTVYALSVKDNYRLIAAGSFSSPAGKLAVWDRVHVISGQIITATDMPVPGGIVKAVTIDTLTKGLIVSDSAVIQIDGSFQLNNVPVTPHLVIGFPDDELDFIPTYYPSGISWKTATPITSDTNSSNINISVTPLDAENQPGSIGGRVVLNFTPPFTDPLAKSGSIIYASLNGVYKGFAVTDANQRYVISSLPAGNYSFYVDRIGYNSASRFPVTLNYGAGHHLDSVNFVLDPDDVLMVTGNTGEVKTFNLHQNYPNPFNPSTTIKFNVVKAGNVKLAVYNALGKKVAELVNGKRQPGSYGVDWNGESSPSGVYFYRLEVTENAGGKPISEVKKMLLIK
jgi:hypothetical protein